MGSKSRKLPHQGTPIRHVGELTKAGYHVEGSVGKRTLLKATEMNCHFARSYQRPRASDG
jgi:hypothetical protein